MRKRKRCDEAQAMVEWVILMVPLCLLFLIPFLNGQFRMGRIALLGSTRYAIWDQAVNGGSNTASDVADIFEHNTTSIYGRNTSLSSTNQGSIGVFSSLQETAIEFAIPGLSSDYWEDEKADADTSGALHILQGSGDISAEMVGILTNLAQSQSSIEPSQVSFDDVPGALIADTWYPGIEDPGRLVNTDTAKQRVKDTWAVPEVSAITDAINGAIDAINDFKATEISIPPIGSYTMGELLVGAISLFYEVTTNETEDLSDPERCWYDPKGIIMMDKVPKPSTD
jgi:hypothetical protein